MEGDIMTVGEFLFDLPLYHKVPRDDSEDIINFLMIGGLGRREVDGYNPIEQCESTFAVFCSAYYTVHNDIGSNSLTIDYVVGKSEKFDTFEVILRCKRYGTFLHYLVHVEYDKEDYEHSHIMSISKVGQYPSVADFHIGRVHQYDKVLQREKMREFTKAIGLAANGVGIGSFVYLRRIFEHLVFEAKNTAKATNPEFDETAFISARMNERILMLSGYLPEFLVENHTIYGILSKGIHELSEDVCNKHFSILRESIEMILDEKLEAYQKEQKRKSIKQALSKIAGEIK